MPATTFLPRTFCVSRMERSAQHLWSYAALIRDRGERVAASPRVSHGAGAGVGGGAGGELAVEFGEQGDAVGDAILGAGGDKGGILHGHGAVDDEARAGKGLEHRRQ